MPTPTFEAIRSALVREPPTTPYLHDLTVRREDGSLLPAAPPPGSTPRPAAVLVPLFVREGALLVLLTRRTMDVAEHRGQISFPGGGRDAGDESLLATALREAREELGLALDCRIEIAGQLPALYIPPSNFEVTPFVGWLGVRPALVPNPREVAEVIEVPLASLRAEGTLRTETWQLGERRLIVPFYLHQGHKIWGATARMLSALLARLEASDVV